MRTSGKGNDITMIVLPAVLLLGFATYFLGGPGEVLRLINTAVGRVVEGVSDIVSALL
jgi:hypothetical protein